MTDKADEIAREVVSHWLGSTNRSTPMSDGFAAALRSYRAEAEIENGPEYGRGYEDCWRKMREHLETILVDRVPDIVQNAMRVVESRAFLGKVRTSRETANSSLAEALALIRDRAKGTTADRWIEDSAAIHSIAHCALENGLDR